jgi:hypothetical protein
MNRRSFLKKIGVVTGIGVIAPSILIKLKTTKIPLPHTKKPKNADTVPFLLSFFDGVVIESAGEPPIVLASAKLNKDSFEPLSPGEHQIHVPPMTVINNGIFGDAWLVKGSAKVSRIIPELYQPALVESDTLYIENLIINSHQKLWWIA